MNAVKWFIIACLSLQVLWSQRLIGKSQFHTQRDAVYMTMGCTVIAALVVAA